MSDSPDLSVVIPAFNVAHVLGEQLDALAAQIDAPPFEVVVADNGSTDATADVAHSYRGPFEVRVVNASQRRGAAHARNMGAQAARGGFLLFCDSDDLVGAHWIAALVAARAQHPGAIVSGALHHERFNDADVQHAYTLSPDPAPSSDGLEPVRTDPGPFAGYLPTAPGGNFAIDREQYLAVGGMDSSYPGGSEETDFVWRVQRTGAPVVVAPSAIVHYRLRATARAMFRQQRIQQFAKVLLWMRYRDAGMHGPSVKFSVLALLKLAAEAPVRIWTRRGRLYLGRWAGGHVGALHGMWHYRVRKRLPEPQMMEHSDAG